MAGSRNYVFNDKTLDKLRAAGVVGVQSEMTVTGTINKVGILTTLTILGAAISWRLYGTSAGDILYSVGLLINLILGFVIIFKKPLAPTLAPVYAVLEGFVLGSFSAGFESIKPGIVSNSLIASVSILFGMLAIYNFRIIKVDKKFNAVLLLALFGISMTYIADIVLSLLGHPMDMIHQSGPQSMVFSGIVIVVASLCFLSDFAMIEKAVEAKSPKWMEWYAGFSVLLTLIWLYLEILRALGRKK